MRTENKQTVTGIVAILAFLVIASFLTFKNVHQKSNGSISPCKIKEDLDFLFKTIEEVHPNIYDYIDKERFFQYRNELYEQINHPMNHYEFYKLTAPLIALLRSGHTYIIPPIEEFQEYIAKGGKVFPLTLHWDDTNIVLAENFSTTELPLGKKVLSINGKPALKELQKFACLMASEGKISNQQLLERTDILRLLFWLEYGQVDSWDLILAVDEFTMVNYKISSITLNNSKSTPVFDKKNCYYNIPEFKTGVIELNSFGNGKQLKKFEIFLDETFNKMQRQNVVNLIIDVRKNPGGNDKCGNMLLDYLTDKPYSQFKEAQIKISSQTQEKVAPLRLENPEIFTNKKEGDTVTITLPLQTPRNNPRRFTGRIFVIIGPGSFSTSTSFASAIKAFHIGTLVGQETGDPTILYADSAKFLLPNSKLKFAVATKAFKLASDRAEFKCKGVIPDYEVKQKSEDTKNGIDTVLQFTLDLIKASVPNNNIAN